MRLHSRHLALVLAGFAALHMGQTAQADVLIQDDFSRTGALNGSSPSINIMSGGGHWNAPTSYTTNGSTAIDSASPGASNEYVAGVPFDLQSYAAANPNSVLTLSATVTVTNTTDNGSWVSVGFMQNVGNLPFGGSVSAGPWALLRADGGMVEMAGPGISAGAVGTTPDGAATSTTGTLSITYDTSTNVANFYLDSGSGAVLEASTTYDSAPADMYVGFSTEADGPSENTVATFSNFSLTSVPEPASATILGVGGLMLLSRRRRTIK